MLPLSNNRSSVATFSADSVYHMTSSDSMVGDESTIAPSNNNGKNSISMPSTTHVACDNNNFNLAPPPTVINNGIANNTGAAYSFEDEDAVVGVRADRHLPFFFRGSVVHCFGRGGRSLNCPTANLDPAGVAQLPPQIENGVYAGFVRLNGETVDMGAKNRLLPMVMSVGYNPQFDNKQLSLEVHVLRRFDHDFYGATMEGVGVRFIRAMHAYPTLDELMAAIEGDKRSAGEWMTETLKRDFEVHEFFCAQQEDGKLVDDERVDDDANKS